MSRQFRLKEEHIKLLSRSYITKRSGYSGYEVAGMDGKRPYGNSDVIEDIHEIFTGNYVSEDEEEEYEIFLSKKDYYEELHDQIDTALQVTLATLSFSPGLYEADDYRDNWRKISD